jgi:hypothetical protein
VRRQLGQQHVEAARVEPSQRRVERMAVAGEVAGQHFAVDVLEGLAAQQGGHLLPALGELVESGDQRRAREHLDAGARRVVRGQRARGARAVAVLAFRHGADHFLDLRAADLARAQDARRVR